MDELAAAKQLSASGVLKKRKKKSKPYGLDLNRPDNLGRGGEGEGEGEVSERHVPRSR
jgi:hypothetical protein